MVILKAKQEALSDPWSATDRLNSEVAALTREFNATLIRATNALDPYLYTDEEREEILADLASIKERASTLLDERRELARAVWEAAGIVHWWCEDCGKVTAWDEIPHSEADRPDYVPQPFKCEECGAIADKKELS